ncbi:MAG TPA: type II toxin-antitoxin system HicA family toxin [Candidatus Saccharimonadales bacterium]|nr:type II toxin-antitoxin system HicA family toxin [Candidatus Saccharimonadales bacterium]
MSKLPRNVKPQRLIKFLQKLGFEKGEGRGSHIRMVHPDGRWTQVAVHPGPIPTGTLSKIVRQAELSEDDLKEL